VSVLTSRFEGLPNVVIESLALGVPVVSTACEFGPGEILGNNEYGVLTPVGDPAAFAAAVEALLDDPVRRRHLSEVGPTRARDFDLRRIAPAYEELLTRTAGLRPARESVAS
jgi:glycosyltransferase involved in cell wall biosynthesis